MVVLCSQVSETRSEEDSNALRCKWCTCEAVMAGTQVVAMAVVAERVEELVVEVRAVVELAEKQEEGVRTVAVSAAVAAALVAG